MALLKQVLWFVKPLLAVYGFVYQKMYGVVALARASAYCCSQFSKFYTILDATGSTHCCLCWSVVLRKIGSVMSSSCCYVCGRARVRACVCSGFSPFNFWKSWPIFAHSSVWAQEDNPVPCFFFIFWRVGKIAKKRLLASSCLSVCLLVCPSASNNLASTGRIFMKFYIWVFFENLSKKFKSH